MSNQFVQHQAIYLQYWKQWLALGNSPGHAH